MDVPKAYLADMALEYSFSRWRGELLSYNNVSRMPHVGRFWQETKNKGLS
jgi:hypothetical protein